MKPRLLLIAIFFIHLHAYAQPDLPKIAHKILAEATILYNSERASWNGTDIFRESPKYLAERHGGYFSYAYGDSERCVFFSDGDAPYAIATITFDSSFDKRKASLDLMNRPLTSLEKTLFAMRKRTFEEVLKDTALFRRYPKTNYNLVPVVANGEKKMYIITATTEQNKIVFGNDYLLTFDANNEVITKKKLHKSVLVNDYKTVNNDTSSKIVEGMHTHLPEYDEFITVTDLCTLMLYAPFFSWDRYGVVSEKYLSVWQRTQQGNSLVIIPTSDLK